MEVVASAPGKLFVLGEYGVLAGGCAIVAATERRLGCRLLVGAGAATLRVERAGESFAVAPEFERVSEIPERHRFALTALLVATRACGMRTGSYILRPGENLDLGAAKVGLGGSAAITAAVFAAVAALPDAMALRDPMRRAHLALQAHRLAQGGGSGADVITATLGGLLYIPGVGTAAAPNDVGGALQAATSALRAEKIQLPPGLALEAVASGRPARSGPRAQRFGEALAGHAWLGAPGAELLGDWVGAMADATNALRAACLEGAADAALAALRQGRELFRILPALSGIPVWTRELRRIDQHLGALPAAVKPSGAGGGDCAIALLPTSHRDHWRAKAAQAGFASVALAEAAEGASARIERIS